MLADNEGPEKKRKKSHEVISKYCVVKGSSNSKEQQLLEAAAFHLILLGNPLQESHNYNNECDSNGLVGNRSSPGAGLRMMTGKKKKRDSELEGISTDKNDEDANSVTSSSSSSSETIKSVISSISMEKNEVEDGKGTAPRLQQRRLRSIVDIYHVTRPL